jgi:hypothetical protein
MAERHATFEDIAALLAAQIPRPNPVRGGVIDGDLYLTNDSPIVAVQTGDALRKAVYLPPHAIQPGGPVFVMRMSSALTSDLVVIATNVQAGGGLGTGGLGTGPLGR